MSPSLPQERWHPVSRKSYVTITVADLRGGVRVGAPTSGKSWIHHCIRCSYKASVCLL